MSRLAQAEREKQARVILGSAELAIAGQFVEAANLYAGHPISLQLGAISSTRLPKNAARPSSCPARWSTASIGRWSCWPWRWRRRNRLTRPKARSWRPKKPNPEIIEASAAAAAAGRGWLGQSTITLAISCPSLPPTSPEPTPDSRRARASPVRQQSAQAVWLASGRSHDPCHDGCHWSAILHQPQLRQHNFQTQSGRRPRFNKVIRTTALFT